MSHSKAIKSLYSAEQLDEIAARAKSYPFDIVGHKAFAKYQRQLIERLYYPFFFDFFAMSSITVGANKELQSIQSALLDLPDEILIHYPAYADEDDLSLTAYANPGRAIAYTQIRSHNSWTQGRYFREHLAKYGIYRASSIVFKNPGHVNSYISFDYLGGVDNTNWHNFDFTQLELVSFPFAIACLFRTEKIDEAELNYRFGALKNLSRIQLENLRKYINAPHQSLKQQASELGIEEVTLKESLYKIRNQVAQTDTTSVLSFQIQAKGSLRPLDAYFGFLTMLSDHTRPIYIIRV